MKKVACFFVVLLLAMPAWSQDNVYDVVKALDETISELVATRKTLDCDAPDPLPTLEKGYNLIQEGLGLINQLKAADAGTVMDQRDRLVRMMGLFELFYSSPCAASIFTQERYASLAARLLDMMPARKALRYSDLKYKLSNTTQQDFDLMYGGRLSALLSFYNTYADSSRQAMAVARLINLIQEQYDNDARFIVNLVNDENTLFMEWFTKALRYHVPPKGSMASLERTCWMIELTANRVLKARKSDSLSYVGVYERTYVSSAFSRIVDELKANHINDRTLFERLMDHILILEGWETYLDLYAYVLGLETTHNGDRWIFFDRMKALIVKLNEKHADDFYASGDEHPLVPRVKALMSSQVKVLRSTTPLSIGNEVSMLSLGDETTLLKFKEAYAYLGEEAEWSRLSADMEELAAQKARDDRKAECKRKWGFSVGFAPLKTLLVPGAQSYFVDLKTVGLSHGGRLCLFDNHTDNFRFGSWVAKHGQPGGATTYDGYELSYWLGLFADRDDFVFQQVQLEYRYGRYAFQNLPSVNLLNRETGEVAMTGVAVDPLGIGNDVTLGYRLRLYATNALFFEGSLNLGLGYRTLSSNYDLKTYVIDDMSFNADRWPTLFIPMRLGFRMGITLF
jgi:hypothetical protein